jgi:ABC-type multidrug transport system fused ATPase/permease subunit
MRPMLPSIHCTILTLALSCVVASHEAILNWLRDAYDTTHKLELVWPPSRMSAPAIVSVVVFVVGVCIVSIMESTDGEAQRRLHTSKRRKYLAQLSQALRWDEDDTNAEADEEEGTMAKEAKPKEDKVKRPPEAKELFEMLFDEVEERHVTEYGISRTDETYVEVLALFHKTVPEAIKEATRCTRIARGLATEQERTRCDEPKRVALFKDGVRLRNLLDIYEGQRRGAATIKRHFGELVEKEVLEAARSCSALVDREQRASGIGVLLALCRPHLPLYALSGLLMAFDSAIGAANWHSVSQLLDGVDAGNTSLSELRSIFLQTYLKFVLCVFSHLTSCYMTEKVAGRFGNAVKTEVLRGVLRQDTVFFDIYPSGVIQERLNHDANDLTDKCFHLPMRILHMALIVISNSIAVYHINPDLLWICLAPLPFIAIIQKVFISRMKRMEARGRKIAEHVVANTNEVIKELRTVRSFAMEGEEAELYDAQSQYRTQIKEQTSIVHHCLFIAPIVLTFIGTRMLATYAGGSYVAARLITVGMAVQVGNAADHLQHCVRSILEEIPEILKVLGPVGRICDAISTMPLIEPFPGAQPKLTIPIIGQLEFVDVSFTFPSEPQKQILSNFSFTAAPGEKVALVGGTGSGKSTALQLIQRFYEPSEGQVLLDGRPIKDFDVHYLRRCISVVAQDNVLFSTTIRDNVTYGLPKAVRDTLTDEAVEDACRKANAWEFVQGFPRALQTFCGERGVKLSGGQKQRLAIARAIIRRPKICLLDEATSALDSKAEGVVQAALDAMINDNAQGCTLVVAHRLSTVKNCDKILCLDKGRVAEQGTHDELLEIKIEKDENGATVAGLYNDLWATQMGVRKPEDCEMLKQATARAVAAELRLASLELKLVTLGALEAVSEPGERPPTPSRSSSSSSSEDGEHEKA